MSKSTVNGAGSAAIYVAGSAPSLSQAIEEQGWPSVEESRGRIAFVMFGGKRHKRAYSAGRPRLDGRMMFVAERKLGAPGEFARAYVIAHEVGPHVQNQLGILGKVFHIAIEQAARLQLRHQVHLMRQVLRAARPRGEEAAVDVALRGGCAVDGA